MPCTERYPVAHPNAWSPGDGGILPLDPASDRVSFGSRHSVAFSPATVNMTRRNIVLSAVGAQGATLRPAAAQFSTAAPKGNAGPLLDLVSPDDPERAEREQMASIASNTSPARLQVFACALISVAKIS